MTETTERHHEIARHLIENVQPANLKIRIAEMLAAAHEEGRHEERERCARIVMTQTQWPLTAQIALLADKIRCGE